MGAEINQRIGDYEILGELGRGGMGKVYRVRNVISDRVEAMKVLLPDLAGREELAARFLREIKLLASLHHPNIATLCTAMNIDNQLVMIMEFVEGVTLTDLLNFNSIAIEDGVDYIGQALGALSYAHQRGIIHRDIKPSNIMLTDDRVVKLMDFGIARSAADQGMTQTGTTLGSLNYMSPEQITGKVVDARSDIYSTGISLYEIVTGQRPFRADTDYDLMVMTVKEAPKPPIELRPSLPPSLNEVILTAIAKIPDERFQTADAFREALKKAQGALKTASLPPVRMGTVLEVSQPTLIPAPARDRTQLVTERTQLASQVSGQVVESAALARRNAGGRRNTTVALVTVAALTAVGVPAAYMTMHRAATTTASATVPVAKVSGDSAPAKAGTVIPPLSHVVSTAPPVTPSAIAPSKTSAQPDSSRVLAVNVRADLNTQKPTPPQHQSQPPAARSASSTITPEAQTLLDNLELRLDKDTNNVAAINNSLNTMQAQDQKEGISLRGDVVAQQSSMNLNLSKAQKAFDAHDADRCDRFTSLAESDIAQLQKFLGR